MRPIVIYVGKSDEIKLTKEEFEKYLNEAYSAGYDAGYANACKPYVSYPWWTNTQPTITTPNTQPLKITWDTGTQPEIDLPHITCDAANDLSSYTTKTAGSGATYDCTKGVLKHEKT